MENYKWLKLEQAIIDATIDSEKERLVQLENSLLDDCIERSWNNVHNKSE